MVEEGLMMVLLCLLPLTSFLSSSPASSYYYYYLLLVEVVGLLSPGKLMGLVWSEAQFNLGEGPKTIPK